MRELLRLAPYSDDIADRSTARHELSVRLAAAQAPAKRVLDIGCANGWFESLSEHRLASQVCGIDVTEAKLEQAKRNAPRAEYVPGSVLALPFPDGTFDGVVMFEVIEHLRRNTEPDALREVRRVLAPGGWLVLSTPFAHPVSMALDPAWYLGHRHYSRARITALMQRAGFRTVDAAVRGGLWELSGVIALYAFKWLLGAEAPLKELVERHRAAEFLEEREGISNIFVQAVAV